MPLAMRSCSSVATANRTSEVLCFSVYTDNAGLAAFMVSYVAD